MSLDACALIVQRSDPDRFYALMAFPVELRRRLLPLYAFNVEIARIPWVVSEPVLAEMRFQWWYDVLGGTKRPAHEVAGPVYDLVVGQGEENGQKALPLALLHRLITARRQDIYNDPFENTSVFSAYLNETGGGLMWLAALSMGANTQYEEVVRGIGWAAALAGYCQVVPELKARGKYSLGLLREEDILTLIMNGLMLLSQGREVLKTAQFLSPACFPACQARPVLKRISKQPSLLQTKSAIAPSEFSRRWRFLWLSLVLKMTGRIYL